MIAVCCFHLCLHAYSKNQHSFIYSIQLHQIISTRQKLHVLFSPKEEKRIHINSKGYRHIPSIKLQIVQNKVYEMQVNRSQMGYRSCLQYIYLIPLSVFNALLCYICCGSVAVYYSIQVSKVVLDSIMNY